jgi:hypothetical protein
VKSAGPTRWPSVKPASLRSSVNGLSLVTPAAIEADVMASSR